MSVASFGRGRTVYGNGSFAPTRGRVSAEGARGYLQRELRNQPNPQQPNIQGRLGGAYSPFAQHLQNRLGGFDPGAKDSARQRPVGNQGLFGGVSLRGQDGQSDTRSGVAQQMLARIHGSHAGNGPLGNRPNAGQSLPWRQGNGGVANPTPQDGGKRPPGDGGGGTKGGGGKGGGGQPQLPPPKQMNINADGTLKLPYDSEFSQQMLGATQDMNNQLLQLQMDQQQQAQQYNSSLRDANQQYDVTKRTTLNNNSGAGTAFSSAYGVAVGDNANAYNNQINDLNSANAAYNNSVSMQRMGIQNAFNQMLAQAGLQRADNLAGQAGSLGFGGSDNRSMGKTKHKGKGGKVKGHGSHGSGGRPTPPTKPTNPQMLAAQYLMRSR